MKKLALALIFTALLCFNSKSQDFIQTNASGFRDVAVTADGKIWGCGTNGTVWYSTNGTTWNQTEASGVKSIGASNDNVVICGDNETVWVGDRNGARFQQTTATGFQDVAISPNGRIVGAGTNETIWTSSIQSPNNWSRTEASGFISVDNNSNNIVAAGSNGTIWFANINGTGWTKTSASGFQQVSVAPSGAIYAVGTNGTLWSSSIANGGQNWNQMGITDVRAVDLNDTKIVAVKNDGTIWYKDLSSTTITLTDIDEWLCPRGASRGDREFDGHGPRVKCEVTLKIGDAGRALYADIYFWAQETTSDWSTTERRWSKKVYDAPYGKTITAINSDKASRTQFVSPAAGFQFLVPGNDVASVVNGFLDGAGGAISSAVLASFGIPPGDFQAVARLITGAINNGNTVVRVPAIEGTLVKFFHIVGDTGGPDISDDDNCNDDTRIVKLEFNPVSVTLR